MATVTVLGEAVGIQWQGIVENQAINPYATGDVLVVGQFRRGRLDKPMTITQQNIRSELGYDFNNMDYQTVQHILDMGVESVKVMRIFEPNDSIGAAVLLIENQFDAIQTDPDFIDIALY